MKHMTRFVIVLCLAFFASAALFSDPAFAIAAWARKYDVSCSVCHYPVVPRLNATGHKFRRAGYRMDDEFNKAADWTKAGNYVAMRARARYEYEDPEVGTTTSQFNFHDATFFFAGPIAKNFSGFVELEREGPDELVAVVHVGGVFGEPDRYWSFRIGQMHTLVRVGYGGFDRPTGISKFLPFDSDLTANTDVNFKLKQDQRGVEVAYVFGDHRVLGQILNGANGAASAGGSNATTDVSDDNQNKAFMFVYEWMYDDLASGLTAMAYKDTIGVVGASGDQVEVRRYALTANKVWENGFEVGGGLFYSKDDPEAAASVDITGKAYYLDVEQYFENALNLTIFGRFEEINPNDDADDDKTRRIVAGFTFPTQEHLRWAFEYRNIKQETGPGTDLTEDQIVAEIMLNF